MKVPQQAFQAGLHAGQIQVVAEAGLERNAALPRLVRVDFPRMKVEDARLPVRLIDVAHAPTPKDVGQQPEVSASATRQVSSRDVHGRNGNLQQCRRVLWPEGKTRRIGHAIKVVMDRVDARAVGEAAVLQHLERPEIAGTDGIAGGAVAQNFSSADVFQQRLGTPHIVTELGWILLGDADMRHAMTGQLVPLGDDAAHQLRKLLRYPAQGEKRGLHPMVGKQVQDPVGIVFHSRGKSAPFFPADLPFERRHLEIVLHIDGQRVHHGGGAVRHGSDAFLVWCLTVDLVHVQLQQYRLA